MQNVFNISFAFLIQGSKNIFGIKETLKFKSLYGFGCPAKHEKKSSSKKQLENFFLQ